MRIGRVAVYGIYGLRYLVAISREEHDRPVTIAEIAKISGLSDTNLAKIFQHLVRCRLLRSDRGPKGGFRLGRPASDISLFQIIEAIEGPMLENGCLITTESCSSRGDCIIGEKLHLAEEAMNRVLRETSLAELTKPCIQCPNPRGLA